VFYVLQGELTVRLGSEGKRVAAPAGALARVPPLVVHGFGNETDDELRYVNLHAPGLGFASYLRAMRDGRTITYDQEPPPADGGRAPADAVVGAGRLVAEVPGLRALLLADVDEIAVVEASMDSGAPAAAPHAHRRHLESVYVLEGELALTAGGEELRAEAGSWVQVPPGVAHTFRASRHVRFLDVHTPGCGVGAFLRALAETGDEQLAAARSAFDQAVAPG
jgi:quercetin dioxygenase-like cupin family protein